MISNEPRAASVFVPSEAAVVRSSRRRWLALAVSLGLLALAAVATLVLYPRFRPRTLDPVERVAESYLQALVKQDLPVQRKLGTIEEPPAIQSFRKVVRDRGRDRTLKGSFAPLASLHRRIEAEFAYDPDSGRFTPKHPLGAAAETLDVLEAAKDEAKKSGIYEKMTSGNPDDIFDAAENYGKVFTKLAEGVLAPKKLVPKYKTLVEESKPPIPPREKELATRVGEDPKTWEALLKRPFHTLRADGPYIYDQAEVNVQVTDQLASLGDPPTNLHLSLTRFRLEGIDTGWRVISARRILDDHDAPAQPAPRSPGDLPEVSRSSGSAP
jgi:hypothetical protein